MAGLRILVVACAVGAFGKRIATKQDAVQAQEEGFLPGSVQPAVPLSHMTAPVQPFVVPRASAPSMSMDRRAALSGAASALLWGAQTADAASTLAKDKAQLSSEESKLEQEDAELAKLGRQELSDELALRKANDAVLEAMAAKKDKAEIAQLEAKVRELQAKEAADGGKKKALVTEVRKESARVSAVKAKVAKDNAEEVKVENKELLEAEEAVLKTTVGKETAGVVSKFFKQ